MNTSSIETIREDLAKAYLAQAKKAAPKLRRARIAAYILACIGAASLTFSVWRVKTDIETLRYLNGGALSEARQIQANPDPEIDRSVAEEIIKTDQSIGLVFCLDLCSILPPFLLLLQAGFASSCSAAIYERRTDRLSSTLKSAQVLAWATFALLVIPEIIHSAKISDSERNIFAPIFLGLFIARFSIFLGQARKEIPAIEVQLASVTVPSTENRGILLRRPFSPVLAASAIALLIPFWQNLIPENFRFMLANKVGWDQSVFHHPENDSWKLNLSSRWKLESANQSVPRIPDIFETLVSKPSEQFIAYREEYSLGDAFLAITTQPEIKDPKAIEEVALSAIRSMSNTPPELLEQNVITQNNQLCVKIKARVHIPGQRLVVLCRAFPYHGHNVAAIATIEERKFPNYEPIINTALNGFIAD